MIHTEKDRLVSHQCESDGLNVPENFSRLVPKVSENEVGWQLVNARNPVYSYARLNSEIRLNMYCAGTEPINFHLVFRKIPSGEVSPCSAPAKNYYAGCGHMSHTCSHWDDYAVLVGVSELVKTPDHLTIPSEVWLEPAYDFEYLFRDFLAVSGNRALKVVSREANGKIGLFPDNREHHLVECVSKIRPGVECDAFKGLRHRLNKFDLLNFIAGVGIELSHEGVGISIEKGLNPTFELRSVLTAPFNRPL